MSDYWEDSEEEHECHNGHEDSDEYGDLDYNTKDTDAEEDIDYRPRSTTRKPNRPKHRQNILRQQRDRPMSFNQDDGFDMQLKVMKNGKRVWNSWQQLTSDFMDLIKFA